jgi:hypothetical protein
MTAEVENESQSQDPPKLYPPTASPMKAHSEVTLASIPGSSEQERLLVVLCQIPGEGSRIEMRQQSWGEGLGWYTQSSVRLEPHQVAELRGALGTGGTCSSGRATSLPREFTQRTPSGFRPRVVHADSA